MGERVLRGSRLGAVSYEVDRGVELAPRQVATYECADGHRFSVPFAAEADVPAGWECRACGASAAIVDGTVPVAKKTKPIRTHWDMLLERRSVADLEVLLTERLAALRELRVGAGSSAAPSKKSA
ncbi:MAG: RNA polymerase-binding protein RbpA [Mycobacteriales bacterium]